MIEFSFNLAKDYQRPVILLNEIETIIDTGAIIPVFSMPAKLVELAFKAKPVLDNANIYGFGGECSGKVYEMEEFRVGGLTYRPFQFFVPNNPVARHPFLLSAAMFCGTDYEINTITNKFTVKVEEDKLVQSFLLKDLKGKLYAQIGDVLIQDNSFEPIKDYEVLFQDDWELER